MRLGSWLQASGRAAVLALCLVGAAKADAPHPPLLRQIHQPCAILSLAYSADGREIAISDKCGVKVRDAETGALVYAYQPVTIEAPAVAFTPDGKTLVEIDDYTSEFADTPSGHGAVIDLASGRTTPLAFQDYGDPPAQTLDLSPDGATAATTHIDGTVRLFRRASGADLKAPPKPGSEGAEILAKQARFTPDGKALAVLYDDGAIRFVDPGSGKLLRKLKPAVPIEAFVFVGADALLAIDRDRRAELLNLGAGKALPTLADGAPPKVDEAENQGVAASRDGKLLAAWNARLGLRVWTRSGGEPIWRSPPEAGQVDAATFAPDGSAIAFSIGAELEVVTLPEGKLVYAKAPGSGLRALDFEADSSTFISFDEAGVIRRWDAGAGRLLSRLVLPAEGSLSAFDGRVAVVADPDKGAQVFDAVSGAKLAAVKGASTIQALALSPDDRVLALADRQTTKGSDTVYGVTLYGLPDGKPLKTLPDTPDTPNALAFSADGKALIVGYQPSRARIFDANSGKMLANTETADKADIYGAHAVRAFADGHAYALRDDFALQVRSLPEGKRLAAFKATYGQNAFAVSSDGRRVALAGDPVELWALTGHKPDRKFAIDGEDADALAFSPDGKRLLIGDGGGQLRLYDLESGALTTTFHALGEDWAAVAADGRFVASGDLGEFVRLAQAGKLLPMADFLAANRRDSFR